MSVTVRSVTKDAFAKALFKTGPLLHRGPGSVDQAFAVINSLCMGHIGPHYAVACMSLSDFNIVAKIGEQVVGFMLAKRNRNAMYVMLVCSLADGAGGALMGFVEALSRKQGASAVQLDAVPKALPFYLHHGYRVVAVPGAPSQPKAPLGPLQRFRSMFRRPRGHPPQYTLMEKRLAQSGPAKARSG